MDNFMDKLAKKFSDSDFIKANEAAEERELQRARERAEENEKLIQEIRRLNLKNVEISEQVGQLIQCGIEQFEEYERRESNASEKAKSETEILEELRENLQKTEENSSAVIQNKIADSVTILQEEILDVKKYILAVKEKQADEKGQDAFTEEFQKNLLEEINQLKESVKALEEHVHKENVKVYRNVQAVVTEQAANKARELGDRLDTLERSNKKGKGQMALIMITLIAAAASLLLQIVQML